MIKIGKYNKLRIARETSVGLFLADQDNEEVLLPNKYCPMKFNLDDDIRVFVYMDKTDRKIATNIVPLITLYEFAKLRVDAVTDAGAFMDWGMEKHLYVPVSESREPMKEGEEYFIYMLRDEKNDRLYGTRRVEKYLDNDDITVEEGQKVDLQVYQDAGFGLSVIVNNLYKGMAYNNETFKDLQIGDKTTGWVKKIREDNKIDISLQPIGYRNFIDPNCEMIVTALEKNDGFLPLNDKSKPEDIYDEFGMSKKAFKKSVGSLYKSKKIELKDNGIQLV